MWRLILPVVLLAFAAANVFAGLSYRDRLEQRRREAEQAGQHSMQAQLAEQRAALEQVRRAAENWQRRAGLGIADAIQLFDAAAVGWEEIALESSGESGQPRLDVLSVRGLAGTVEQLSRVDRRLGPRCRSYRRSPTRDARFLLSCQMKPKRR